MYLKVIILVVCPVYFLVLNDAAKVTVKYMPYGDKSHSHSHFEEPPCNTCPRSGKCVPKVSCPGHVRIQSNYPECHLRDTGQIGICCYSGSEHAAESDLKSRKAKQAISATDAKSVHDSSHTKLKQWNNEAKKLLEYSSDTVVREGSPEFGHHLSFVTSDEKVVDELGRGGLLNLFATQELKERQAFDDEELELGYIDHADGPYCPPQSSCPEPPRIYRSITGQCTNPSSPSWGAVNTGFERLLPPDYSDGIWALRTSTSGFPLPSPRAVSSVLVPDGSYPSDVHNMMFMQFSQFIAHDVSAAVMFSIGNNSAISCCTHEGSPLPPEQLHWACAPIPVDPEDEFFSDYGRTCLSFVRAQLAPASDCSVGYAKQMNGATHIPDLSHIYGKIEEKFTALRAFGGLLKTFNDFGRELPPLTDRTECMTMKDRGACFDSGDHHGNQIISLTALHTIFTREHNRIARALTKLNPHWDEDRIFFETRRLLQAMYQHIIYTEWLPLVIGPDLIRAFDLSPSTGYSSSYDFKVNPSVLTEFSAAAMRFGHSTVDGNILVSYPKSGDMYEAITIPEVMFQPSRLRLRDYLDRLLFGLMAQPMQSVDPFVTVGLTRYMFHGGNPHGLDLASLNIQRGRDYGLRSYNEYRKLCGLQPFTSFDQFSMSASKRLSSVYASVDDIDLWIGGLLEEAVEGGIVGPTFAHIIAEQFRRFKIGDQYFYEYGPNVNPGAFTLSQLEEIKKVTLARIICDNKDGIELTSIPPSAFIRADLLQNIPLLCDSTIIKTVDLSKFKDL